ncbi:MAG: DUF393 domain-containing protein, partial [Ignavibacteriales bacterium]|nr:DUF393 domain-containing protein [Ignavibacteriales bacterium]
MNDQSSRKPSLIYDGDCSFCRIWIDRWKQITGDHVEYAPYQKAADRFPQIPKENFAKSVQFIEDDGKVLSGAHAVLRTLSSTPGKRWILWVYESIPGVASVCEWTYRFIAQHRDGAYTLTRFLWGAHVGPASYVLTRWIFLRLVGVIYFIAFFSLGTQVLGLIGKNGIVPIENFLQLIAHQTGVERYREFPTLVWFSSSDAFLQFLCWGGAALSLVLVVGIAPRIISVLLWIFYLSLFVAGQTFLSFQWDILLLEIGFLTIFLTPAQLLPKLSHEPQPSKMILLLF